MRRKGMKASEFAMALAIAKSNTDLSQIDDSPLFGYGLSDFQPVVVSLEQVAKTIRWQAEYIFGGWDEMEIQNLRRAFVYPMRRVEIIPTSTTCPHCGEEIKIGDNVRA
jgi:hypothetical protein